MLTAPSPPRVGPEGGVHGAQRGTNPLAHLKQVVKTEALRRPRNDDVNQPDTVLSASRA